MWLEPFALLNCYYLQYQKKTGRDVMLLTIAITWHIALTCAEDIYGQGLRARGAAHHDGTPHSRGIQAVHSASQAGGVVHAGEGYPITELSRFLCV